MSKLTLEIEEERLTELGDGVMTALEQGDIKAANLAFLNLWTALIYAEKK